MKRRNNEFDPAKLQFDDKNQTVHEEKYEHQKVFKIAG